MTRQAARGTDSLVGAQTFDPDLYAKVGADWDLPTGLLAHNMHRAVAISNVVAYLVSQRVGMVAVPLRAGMTVSGITFYSGTTALNTGVHQFFGLYDASRNLLGTSADDTSTAWGASTSKRLALTTPYVVKTTGLHYVAILVQATTVPTLMGTAPRSEILGLAPILSGSSSTGQTSLPATGAALTAQSAVPYVQID